MAIGDVTRVAPNRLPGWYYVDDGMYDIPHYGSVYLINDDRPTLVETGIGTTVERVLSLLDHVDVSPEEVAYICPTHVHLDHAGGAGILAERCPNATVAIHPRGEQHLVDPDRLVAGTKQAVGDQWEYYEAPTPISAGRIRSLADGDELDLGRVTLRAHEAPGHAHHQHVFHVPEADAVFTADAAGIYDDRRDELHPTTPPPEFDLEQALADIDTIEDLDPSLLLFSHFGPAERSDLLARYRSVLTSWVDTVRTTRSRAESEKETVERLVAEHAPVESYGRRKAEAETAMNARGVLSYLEEHGDS